MTFNLDQLYSDLERDEGIRLTLYDDYSGKPLKQGSVIVGNPTIGIGWNVASTPLTRDQYRIILSWLVAPKLDQIKATFPWFNSLPNDVQRAFANMAFNLGVANLETFTDFIAFLRAGDYARAADDLEGTKWHRQVGERAERIEALIRNAQSASVA